MKDNIKYFQEMVMPNILGGTYVDGYHIVFDDDSELEIFLHGYFSITDCQKGKDRNNFKRNNTVENALYKLKVLTNTLGFSDTNIGSAVVVNNSKIKNQIII